MNKKIGIVAFSNLRYSPYIKFYTDIFDEMDGIQYDIIYFNRFPLLNEIVDDNHIQINCNSLESSKNLKKKFRKITSFFQFKKSVSTLLKRKKYDFVIVLTTYPAILLSSCLKSNYKKKYIVDIRDYTMDNNKVFRRIEKKVLDNSACNVISSPGYVNFLPKEEYYVCHNIALDCEKNKNSLSTKKEAGRIIISYVGSINYVEMCKKMIDLVHDDERFEFHLYGNEVCGTIISDYLNKMNCDRLKMKGPFLPEDKDEIYDKSDLIFNCYGNNSALLDYALSNKLYDGAIYGKPLLVSPRTLMETESNGFAFSLDLLKSNSLDELFEWYNNFDSEKYDDFRNKFIQNVLFENKKTIQKIKDVIMGGD